MTVNGKTNKVSCPVCSCESVNKWGTKNGYLIYRCNECTHLFAGNVKLASSIDDAEEFRRQITNGMANDDEFQYNYLCEGEKEGGHVFLTAQRILKDLERQNCDNKEWLDIGCGSGYVLAKVKTRGIRPTGIEPGGWGQIAAREKKINVVQGMLTTETFSKKFDYMSATDVLEHQSDPYILMNLIRHYLAEGGRAYLSFPLAGTFRPWLVGARWRMIMPPTHCGFFTKKSFTRLTEKVGFKVEQFTKYNSQAFRGWSHLGVTFSAANKIGHALGFGDQALVVISPNNKDSKP